MPEIASSPRSLPLLRPLAGLLQISSHADRLRMPGQPLALAVIGGLVVATGLTLLVIPCAYGLVPGRRRKAWEKG